MAIIELDARFPTAIPLEAASLLTGEVSYTEEVPIKVRWAIADAGGHSASDADVLVTTDGSNDEVRVRLERGERLYSVGLASAVLPAELPPGNSAGQSEAETPRPEPEFNVNADDPLGIGERRDHTDADAAEFGRSEGTVDNPVYEQSESHGDGQVIEVVEVPRANLQELEKAVWLMGQARQRGEWEARQTHASLLPYLIEETYEFVDAVNDGGDVLGELSDLLLQVLFHAEIADGFDIEDVAAAFVEKMRRRSPYLFEDIDGSGEMIPAEEQERVWNEGRGGPRSQPPEHLPALALAEEAIRRAREMGLKDSDIPVELLAPTPGLELEGGAEARTRTAARRFLLSITDTDPEPESHRTSGADDGHGAGFGIADHADETDDDAWYGDSGEPGVPGEHFGYREEDFASEAETRVMTDIVPDDATEPRPQTTDDGTGGNHDEEPSPWAAPGGAAR